MPLAVDCPACQHPFMVPDMMNGRGVKCPRCEFGFSAAATPANGPEVGRDLPPLAVNGTLALNPPALPAAVPVPIPVAMSVQAIAAQVPPPKVARRAVA